MDLVKFKELLSKYRYELQELDDSLILNIGIDQFSGPEHFKSLIKFLKEAKALFITMLAKLNDSELTVKYFFYPGISSKILIINLLESKSLAIPSISADFPAAYKYEELIEKRHGVKFSGLTNLAPVDACPEFNCDDADSFSTEIPVGPIHAGVIEPGHFHFTCHGEHIKRLEISLGYLHRGIEKQFIGRSIEEGIELAESICGDSVAAYSTAFCQTVEKIFAIEASQETKIARVVMLELERLYNHFADLGGIVNDTGFSLANSFLSALKEQVQRINLRFFGHRYLKTNNGIGTVNKALKKEDLRHLKNEVYELNIEFQKIIKLVDKYKTVIDRMAKTGILNRQVAKMLSVTGLAGRASGISFDSRKDLPFAAYEELGFKVQLRKEGDVYARYLLRIDEVNESFRLINLALEKLNSDLLGTKQSISNRIVRNSAWSFAESARGPVFFYLELDANHRITEVKVRDVSMHNWKALEFAVLKNIVPDFPLCNKSFSLAYAGTDL